jgi:hypothetical protein
MRAPWRGFRLTIYRERAATTRTSSASNRRRSERAVFFEEVDLPGLKTVDRIAEIAGSYPSKGSGERAAWFRDSEGNMLAISELVR